MATSGGVRLHQLITRNYRLVMTAWKKSTSNLLRPLRSTRGELQPIQVRSGVAHPIQSVALLRQSKHRTYGTKALQALRTYTTGAGSHGQSRYGGSKILASRTVSAVFRLTGRTPFASTLRPNLTGGSIGRTSSGYSLGSGHFGGVRYFSHSPAVPAEVIQNVSQAVRAFWLSGHKAQYAGINKHGEKHFTAISALQHGTEQKIKNYPKATPGSFIDFSVNPTITALMPLGTIAGYHIGRTNGQTLQSQGLLDVLSIDFSRALQDLSAILQDIKKLSNLGDLPVSYHKSSSLRVHFPGCDADSVERICHEIGVTRGVVVEDEEFDAFAGTEIALLYPFAPSNEISDASRESMVSDQHVVLVGTNRSDVNWRQMVELRSSACSAVSDDVYPVDRPRSKYAPSLSSPKGFTSNSLSSPLRISDTSSLHEPLEYQDFEGIYKFIELCDDARC